MANRSKTLIPTKVLQDLKCASCLQLLSVPTIIVYPAEDGIYICGRCTEKQQLKNGIRARAYEAVAQLFLFPCQYSKEGCKKTLSWGSSVSDHETSCDFRSFECPTLPLRSCIWTGNAKNMPAHFKEAHRFLYMDKPFFFLPSEDNIEVNKVLSVLDETFLVQTILENNKFYICVKYIGKPPDSGKFCYEIELRGNAQENVLKICSKTTKPVLKFDIEKKNMNEIDVNSLKAVMNTDNIICCINVFEKSPNKKPEPKKQEQGRETEGTKENQKFGPASNVSSSLLTELQCPVCQLYMIPPIFICGTGHSICSRCVEMISICPTCSSPYSGTRNYTLEKLTAVVNYPCRNQTQGCKFVGTSQEIHEHENTCPLAANKCPLEIPEKCNWQGPFSSIKKHVTKSHSESTWMKLNTSVFRNLSSTIYADFHIIEFEKELFKICCKHTKSATGPVRWSFQHLGLGKDKPKYKCEIEFLDVNDTGHKFIINDLCYDTKEYQETFKQSLSIPYNLLEPFIKKDSNIVIFKYNMLRM